MNVFDKPVAVTNVKIILNGLCRNTMWMWRGNQLAEDIDQ
jgi:hypothetical protein